MGRTPQKTRLVDEGVFERILRDTDIDDVHAVMNALRQSSAKSRTTTTALTGRTVTPRRLDYEGEKDDEEEEEMNEEEDEETGTPMEEAMAAEQNRSLKREWNYLLRNAPKRKRRRAKYKADPGRFTEKNKAIGRHKFTDLEKACIHNGLVRRGVGTWKSIKKDFAWSLRNRTKDQVRGCYVTNRENWGYE